MTTTSSLRRTVVSALTLVVIALLGTAHAAGAATIVGNGGDGGPVFPPPVASFTVSPNPAIVNTLPVATTSTTAPIARAAVAGGAAISLYGNGDLVTFDASASSGRGGIDSYEWDLDGNGSFETHGAGDRIVKKRFFSTGTFAIHLRVSDAQGDSTVTTRHLIVHRAPTAKVFAQRTTALVNQQIKLSPSGSTGDPQIARFAWDFNGDGFPERTTTSNQVVPVTYSTPGPHTVTLTVTDTYGATAKASLTLTVERPPAAALTVTPSVAIIGQRVSFDASQSTSIDSPIVDYQWDLDGDGTYEIDSGNVPTLSHRYTSGLHTDVSVLVIDADGFGGVASRELTVQPVKTLPRHHAAKHVVKRVHRHKHRVKHAHARAAREFTKHPAKVTAPN